MSIINRKEFLEKSSYNGVYNQSPYWNVHDWSDHDYWYTTDLNISDDVVQMICSDENLFLLVCNEFEGDIDISKEIDQLSIPRNKIVLISENIDCPNINYWSHLGELGISVHARKMSVPLTLEKKKYNKSFLNLNRRWRIHRPCFVGLLHSMNLLDRGLVSLGRADDYLNWDGVFDTIKNLLKEDDKLYNLFVSNKESICNLPDMYLDTTDLFTPRHKIILPDVSYEDTLKLYQNTYFSVASETFFFNGPGRFFSEKTFKPVAYMHPFILMSQPNSLEVLRQLGYKTFHPFIDESYDTEKNDVVRLKMILNEVERLSNFSDAEVETFIDMVKPITLHNFSNLIRKNNYQYIHKIG
jgi:hypothetical protein